MSVKAVEVLTNCPDAASAERIAEALIEERLAACANIGAPIRSLYRWKGGIAREPETPLLLKTRAELFAPLAARLKDLHPYETPAVLRLDVAEADADYLAWIAAETRAP